MSSLKELPSQPVIRDLNDFDKSSGVLVERLFFNNRVPFILLCFLITVFMGYQAFSLKLGASLEKMIPVNHPYIANYIDHKSDLAGMGNVVEVAIENPNGDIFAKNYLERLREVND